VKTFRFGPKHVHFLAVAVVASLTTALLLDAAALPAAPAADGSHKGALYLVGMGPGDRGLVTLKAAQVLQEADCVFCFEYLKEEVARFAPAAKITVASALLMGRFRGQNPADLSPEMRQRAIESEAAATKFVPQVRELIAAGKTVVFADSGDPMLYCPWSWVTEDFADLEPTVVPGLSSFNAANAALRQSITKHSGSVLISAGDDFASTDEHGRLKMMLVLFTHRTKLDELLPQLRSRYPADTPIAVVTEASYDRQQVIFATLGTILQKVGEKPLPHLYLIYVGDGLIAPNTANNAHAAESSVESNGKINSHPAP
jgi:precorrin-4/cobalt-precorrin-4 C11-methyltransferase